MYVSGPFWGRIVDSRGPRLPLACAFVLLLLGYSGIRYRYDTGIPATAATVSSFGFYMLVLCSFMTGTGANGGFSGAVNSTAKSFPDRAVCCRLYPVHSYLVNELRSRERRQRVWSCPVLASPRFFSLPSLMWHFLETPLLSSSSLPLGPLPP